MSVSLNIALDCGLVSRILGKTPLTHRTTVITVNQRARYGVVRMAVIN